MTLPDSLPVASDPGRRRFLAALGVAQVTAWGALYYSFPVLAGPMAIELGTDRAAVYLAATIALLAACVAAYPVGALIDRGHGRAVMSGGAALGAAALLGWARAGDLPSLYLAFVALGVAQAMTLYEPGFAVVARRYGDDAKRGITALALWGGFASTVFVPATESLQARLGWRDALDVLAAIVVLLALLPNALAIRARRDATSTASVAGAERPVRQALRRPVFWALLVAFTSYVLAFTALTFHLYPALLERGFSAADTVAGIACIGPAQVAGRVVLWRLAERATIVTIGLVTFALFPLSVVVLALLPPDFVWLVPALLVFGAVNGVMTIVRGLAVPEMITREAYGALNGALAAPANLAKAVAPLAAALLWTMFGGYGAVLWVAALVGAIGLLAFAASSRLR